MMDAILSFIRNYGLNGFLLVILILIIQDPDRAIKLKALLISPFFRVFKWGSRQYIASEVGYTTTEFFRRHISHMVPSIPEAKIKIKWVTSPSDPVLRKDGTLILRLQETNDQTRNILTACRIALPHVVCSALRPNLEQYAESALDLTLLRNLTEKLGRHAYPIFQRYFLSPEVDEDPRAAELFARLVQLDQAGIFVSILLEELNSLGEIVFILGDTSDKTSEVISLVEYLLTLATREVGEKMDLEYISGDFRIGILLLAISWKADTEGLPPYLRRIDQKIKMGCDSIYVAAYPKARSFLPRILNAIDSDAQLTLVKRNRVRSLSPSLIWHSGISEIALLRRNLIFDDSTFEESIAALGLTEGVKVRGLVIDLSQNAALVEIGDLFGVISRNDCSWHTVGDCKDMLSVGSSYEFLVKSIDKQKDLLELTLRFPDEDPWLSELIPSEGDIVDVRVLAMHGNNFVCRTGNDIEILLPKSEVSWLGYVVKMRDDLIDTEQKVLVYEKSEIDRLIMGSIRRLEEDPWPRIYQELPKGTESVSVVIEIMPNLVTVELPGGLIGTISKEALLRGGYRSVDLEDEVLIGQSLDVVVTRVIVKKRKIRLDLKSNVNI